MESNKGKRIRGRNFTDEEELLLIRMVSQFKKIVECKMNDKVNNQDKNEAWRKITQYFNANNSCKRTTEQLRMKYENLKKKAKRMVADSRKSITDTEGGPGQVAILDPVMEAFLEMTNKESVVGLYSPWDSDTQIKQDLIGHERVEVEIFNQDADVLQQSETIQETENISDQLSSCSSISQIQAFDFNDHEIQDDSCKSLKDIYYEKKILLVDEEIKKNRMEQQDILNRREREQEAHKKQMELLELEIQLKQRMLNK
ncbi:unnamed protein product [Callosobruchus maculatus]|uniref:Regulatory protein zeste n=1 Tax=Callosobruchus maculatus TaxID=64391 RepID=A0A653CV80_CALMS|nr:unnamed protein product [Callosobruchus maculatus]VEN51778.1 unnamed protein product [Callosobruchus maculatus]